MILLISGGWTDKMGPDADNLSRNWLGGLSGAYFFSGNVLALGPLSWDAGSLLFRLHMYVFLPYLFVLFRSPPKSCRVPLLLLPNPQLVNRSFFKRVILGL